MSKNSQTTNKNLKGLSKSQIDLMNDSDSDYSDWNYKSGTKTKTKVIKKLRKID